MNSPRAVTPTSLVLIVVALFAAACGGPSPEPEPVAPAATTSAPPLAAPTTGAGPAPLDAGSWTLTDQYATAAVGQRRFTSLGDRLVLSEDDRLLVLDATTSPPAPLGEATLPAVVEALAFRDPTTVLVATSGQVMAVDIATGTPMVANETPLAGVRHIVVDGAQAYLASSTTLVALSPDSLAVLGQVSMPDEITALAPAAGLVAVGQRNGTVAMVDATDSANLALLATWQPPVESPQPVRDLALSGTVLLAVSGADGLAIVNVADPALPATSSQFAGGDTSSFDTVSLIGPTALVGVNGEPHGVLVLNLANPALPRPQALHATASPVAAVQPLSNGFDVLSEALLERVQGLADPLAITAALPLGQAGAAVDLAAADQRVWLGLDGGSVQLLDLLAGGTLADAGAWAPGGTPAAVTHANGTLYTAIQSPNGLALAVTGADGPASSLYGYVESGIAAQASDITVDGPIALVAAGQAGLLVFDVVDPGAPSFVAKIGGLLASRVVAAGNYAYVGSASSPNTLQVIDLSSGAVQGTAVLSGVPGDMLLDGGLLYVNAGGGLTIIGVTDPAQPAVQGQYDVGANASAGGLVRLADGRTVVGSAATSTLRVYDTSNPALVSLLAEFPAPVVPRRMAALGDTLLLLDPDAGLAVLAPQSAP